MEKRVRMKMASSVLEFCKICIIIVKIHHYYVSTVADVDIEVKLIIFGIRESLRSVGNVAALEWDERPQSSFFD